MGIEFIEGTVRVVQFGIKLEEIQIPLFWAELMQVSAGQLHHTW